MLDQMYLSLDKPLFLKVLTWQTLPNLVPIMAILLWQGVDSMGTNRLNLNLAKAPAKHNFQLKLDWWNFISGATLL